MLDSRYKPIMNNHIYDTDISYEEVKKELLMYMEKGFGGIAINGRSMVKVKDINEWLPKYFKTVRKYCRASKELDIEMWIFDEWGFPSGTAAGLVLNGKNRAKRLSKAVDIILEKGEAAEIPKPNRFVAAGAIPVNRFAAYHPVGIAEILEPDNNAIVYHAEQKTRLVVVTWEDVSFHTMEMRDIDNMPQDDPTVGTVDILDYDTVRKFIDNMHERYAEAIGEEFGKTVKGFFYDEPEIYWEFPYSPKLPEFFKERHGYELETILPEILAYVNCGGIELGNKEFSHRIRKIYGDYQDAYTAMLEKNFYGQIESWCHEHGLLSVGHQDMDDDIRSINTVSGSFFRNSSKNDMPGIDVIHDDIAPDRFADFPRYAGSIKRALKKSGAMSETFAVMGEFMPPNVRRFDMEHQIVRGIDKFFLYIGVSDTEQGDYKKEAMERADFIADIINSGKSRAAVAVLMPMSDITYTRMCLNPHSYNAAPMPWERVEMLAEALCYAPIDFDYAWEEALDDLYERGFRYLILTGSPVTAEAMKQIEEFHKKGGQVISVFKPCEQLSFAKFKYHLWELLDELPREIHLETSQRDVKISLTTTEADDCILYALLNESDRFTETKITFSNGELSYPIGELSYYDFDRKLWCKAEGICGDLRETVFAPLELKLFRLGGGYDICERVTDVKEISGWRFNGNPIEKLVPWTDLGLDGFSGTGEYETEFEWDGGMARISLGEIRFSAKVFLCGNEYELPFAPWAFYADLPKGKHIMKVIVLNSGASADYAIPDKWHKPWEEAYLRCGMLGIPKIEKIEKVEK